MGIEAICRNMSGYPACARELRRKDILRKGAAYHYRVSLTMVLSSPKRNNFEATTCLFTE